MPSPIMPATCGRAPSPCRPTPRQTPLSRRPWISWPRTPGRLLRASSSSVKHPHWLIQLYSGCSTPVPEDAPPSAHSISTARKQVRARNRLFYTIDYIPRVSHFDPDSDYHNFRGFFILFWISLFIMVVTTVLRNVKDTGYPLRVRVWTLLSANVWELAISDLVMVASSALVLPMHKLYRNGPRWLNWVRGGMILQSIGEAIWLVVWVKYVEPRPVYRICC